MAAAFMHAFKAPTAAHKSLQIYLYRDSPRQFPATTLAFGTHSACRFISVVKSASSASSSSTAAAAKSAAAAAAVEQESSAPADITVQDLPRYPNAAYGQVISAEANYVRVSITRTEAEGDSSNSGSSSVLNTASTAISHRSDAGSNHTSRSASQPPVQQLLCTVRALLKKIGQRVLVGDYVRVHPVDWASGRGVVHSVEPRVSELADPAIANVDHVLLLFGLTHPPFEPAQVSRFLISVGATGLPITLALNKADLLPAAEIQDKIDQVASWGYTAVAVSCETGQGLDALAQQLTGRVSVVAGPSGAGKSSLINALKLGRHKPGAPVAGATGRGAGARLEVQDVAAAVRWQHHTQPQAYGSKDGPFAALDSNSSSSSSMEAPRSHTLSSPYVDHDDVVGDDPNSSSNSRPIPLAEELLESCSNSSDSSAGDSKDFLAVGDVSRLGRGRHTTRTVQLIKLPFGGVMADTPGFNMPTLDRVSSGQLASLFPEFVQAQRDAGGCRFADCMHLEEPGCAVTAAELERHEHYFKFLAEIKAREDYDVRVMQLTKQRREGVMKAKTGRGGVTRYEARLNSKKHRTTSRRQLKQNVWGDVNEDEQADGVF